MRGDAVIAFEEILDHQLPVGIGRIAAGMGDPGIAEPVIIEDRTHIAKGRVEIDRLAFAQIDKDQPVEYPDVARKQAVLAFVEVLRHQPRCDQFAIQAEGPGVVGADQPGRVAALRRT